MKGKERKGKKERKREEGVLPSFKIIITHFPVLFTACDIIWRERKKKEREREREERENGFVRHVRTYTTTRHSGQFGRISFKL